MTTRRRVVLIGLDSITPTMIDPLIAEGHMPNLADMRSTGWHSKVTPTFPATTPAGWTTIATGAWPSTHGIEGFVIRRGGMELDAEIDACNTRPMLAEPIWRTAEAAGRRTILLKFPMTWPPTGGPDVVQVDGAAGWGGLKCVWDLASSGCWDTRGPEGSRGEMRPSTDKEWRTRDQDNLYEEDVQRLPVLDGGGRRAGGFEARWATEWEVAAGDGAKGTVLHAVAVQTDAGPRVAIATSADAGASRLLARGEWSDWLEVERVDDSGRRTGHVRFKVMELDVDARVMRLYQSQAHDAHGYCRPPELCDELLRHAGPFVEWTESYDLLQGWIDDATQLEIYDQHARWMSDAARHLMASQEWDLFMTQIHFLDMAYHLYWGAIDPRHPHYDPERASHYRTVLARAHALADRFVGEVRDAAGDALVLVVGDHGHDVYHTSLLVNHHLATAGFLKLTRDRRTGKARVDWSRTRAYAQGYRVYVNLAGRDPHGIVQPDEYEATRDELIESLYALRDRHGRIPVRLAVRREDVRPWGLYGDSIGDVVVATGPGFQSKSTVAIPDDAWRGTSLRRERVRVFRDTTLLRDFTGEHDTHLPLLSSLQTMLFASGPGVAHGGAGTPVRLVDLAPTMAAYLGIPAPADNEGSSLLSAIIDDG
ncbi:MAG TPA: alkaline phosphatase family protein [Actinomycetota bacterium]|nr:alkaline phosphatase family protein [Actinomycetota bacterium]